MAISRSQITIINVNDGKTPIKGEDYVDGAYITAVVQEYFLSTDTTELLPTTPEIITFDDGTTITIGQWVALKEGDTLPIAKGLVNKGLKVYIIFRREKYTWSDGRADTYSVASLHESDQRIVEWCSASDKTFFDGSKIYAGSVHAEQIATNAITAEKIAANAITTAKLNAEAVTADKIKAGTIIADNIAANAITAEKLSTDAITSRNYYSKNGEGEYVKDENGQLIKSGVGSKLNLADGTWNSAHFEINEKGEIIATGGNIGGWVVRDTSLIGATPGGAIMGLFTNYKGLPTSTDINAPMTDTSLKVGNSGSQNNWRILIGNSSSFNFGVDGEGKLYATAANISGTITADGGKIGNWLIGSDLRSDEEGEIILDPNGTAQIEDKATGLVFKAGNNFGVDKTGKLYATDANISGKIVATEGSFSGHIDATSGSFSGHIEAEEGQIANFNIVGNRLTSGNGDGFVNLQSAKYPQDYVLAEYIESSGTQYIDTGVYSANNITIEVDTQLFAATSVYGSYTGYRYTASTTQSYFYYFHSHDGNNQGYKVASSSDRTVIKQRDNICYRDGVAQTPFEQKAPYKDSYSIFLFASNNRGNKGDAGRTRIYGCKIWEDDKLIRNFVPVYRNNEFCMYETCYGQYYTNKGTEAFNGVLSADAKDTFIDQDGISYQVLDYIEGSGTQYINTGFDDNNSNNLKIEAKFSMQEFSQYAGVFGNYVDEPYSCWRLLLTNTDSSNGNYWVTTNRRAGGSTPVTIPKNTINDVIISKDKIVINNVLTPLTNFNDGIVATTPQNIVIFAQAEGHVCAKMRLYEFRIYNNGTQVRNYIPVLKNRSEYGLYDLVTKTFYGNNGTGAFTGAELTDEFSAIYLGAPTPEDAPFSVTNTGKLKAKSGTIAGWTIDSNKLTSGTIGEDGSFGVFPKGIVGGLNSTADGLLASGDAWVMTAGSKFGVTKNGALYATNADISGKITATSGKIGGLEIGEIASKQDVDNIEIGGRNLIADTDNTTVYSGNKGNSEYKDVWVGKTIVAPTDTQYIVSFDARAEVAQNIKCFFYSPNTTLTSESSTGQLRENIVDGNAEVSITTEWKRYWVKWTQTPTDTIKNIIVGRNDTANNIYIRAVKLEKGNKATAWTPAPEDQINSNVNNEFSWKFSPTEGMFMWNGTQGAITADNPTGGAVFAIYNDKGTHKLAVKGHIEAESGNIAGWKIDSNSLTKGTFGTNGIHLYSQEHYAKEAFGEEDKNWMLGIGSNFGVTNDGVLYAKAGKIGDTEIGDIASTSHTGGINLLRNSGIEKGGDNLFVAYADLALIFNTYGLIEYTISFDIKSKDPTGYGYVQVYCHNGNDYYHEIGTPSVPVTTEYTRQSITVTPRIANVGDNNGVSNLAFYGYGGQNYPIIKNVKVELGGKATPWCLAPGEAATSAELLTLKESVVAKAYEGDSGCSWTLSPQGFVVEAREDNSVKGGITVNKEGLTVTGNINTSRGTIGSLYVDSFGLRQQDDDGTQNYGIYCGEQLVATSTSKSFVSTTSPIRFYSGAIGKANSQRLGTQTFTKKNGYTLSFTGSPPAGATSFRITSVSAPRQKVTHIGSGKGLSEWNGATINGKFYLYHPINIPTLSWLPSSATLSTTLSAAPSNPYEVLNLGDGNFVFKSQHPWTGGWPPHPLTIEATIEYSYEEVITPICLINSNERGFSVTYKSINPYYNQDIKTDITYHYVTTGYNFSVAENGSVYSKQITTNYIDLSAATGTKILLVQKESAGTNGYINFELVYIDGVGIHKETSAMDENGNAMHSNMVTLLSF